MKKIFILLIIIISLTACSKKEPKEIKPSVYKKAIDDSKQIQINIDKQLEINKKAIQ